MTDRHYHQKIHEAKIYLALFYLLDSPMYLILLLSTLPSPCGSVKNNAKTMPTIFMFQQTGLSPLAPGQKTSFLALYAGFTITLNILRPVRFAFSMALSPYFERLDNFFQRKFGVSQRIAVGMIVVFVNLIGTCSLLSCGVGLASVLSGVPMRGRL